MKTQRKGERGWEPLFIEKLPANRILCSNCLSVSLLDCEVRELAYSIACVLVSWDYMPLSSLLKDSKKLYKVSTG